MAAVATRPVAGRASRPGTDENAEAARLFGEHAEELLGFCWRQLGSRSEAEDAVQTTFLYALRGLRRGVVPECDAAWLTAIAKNVCHAQRRTRDRRGSLTSGRDLDDLCVAQPVGDEDGVLDGLQSALASIPETQRQAIVLREWRGVPPREIASLMGMSAPATHALLTRARHSLAEALSVARKPVVGLGWLVVELRAQLGALFGGAAAKTAAVVVIAVGVGVSGAAVEASREGPAERATPTITPRGVDGLSTSPLRARDASPPSAPLPGPVPRRDAAAGAAAATTPASPPRTPRAPTGPRPEATAPTARFEPAAEIPRPAAPEPVTPAPKAPEQADAPPLTVPAIDAPDVPRVELPKLPPVVPTVEVPTVPPLQPPELDVPASPVAGPSLPVEPPAVPAPALP